MPKVRRTAYPYSFPYSPSLWVFKILSRGTGKFVAYNTKTKPFNAGFPIRDLEWVF